MLIRLLYTLNRSINIIMDDSYNKKPMGCLVKIENNLLIEFGIIAHRDIIVIEFKVQSYYYIQFRTYTLEKGMSPLIPLAIG